MLAAELPATALLLTALTTHEAALLVALLGLRRVSTAAASALLTSLLSAALSTSTSTSVSVSV